MGQVMSEHFLAPGSQGAVIGTPRQLSSAIFLCERRDLGFHDEQKEDADGCSLSVGILLHHLMQKTRRNRRVPSRSFPERSLYQQCTVQHESPHVSLTQANQQ